MILDTKNRIQSKKPRKSLVHPRSISVGLFLLALLILLDHAYRGNSAASFLSRFVIQPVSVIQQAKTQVTGSLNRFVSYFSNHSLVDELKMELENSKLENIRLKQQMSELTSYREAMRFPHDPEFPGVVAIVKLRDNRLTESIIIDRGRNDGVTINRPVYSPGGLVGRTFKVTRHFSKVQPVTDPGSAISVYIEGTMYEGILRGGSERNAMILTDLHMNGTGDETIAPQPGMRLFTSGTGKVFPRDLIAGIIESTTAEEGYICRPTADSRSVRSVIVLKSNDLQDEMLSLLTDE